MQQGAITYVPILVMMFLALGFIVTTMLVTHILIPWLSPKNKSKVKDEIFECGIESQGNARTPFSIKYFLVAVLFVLFDVEVIFMYPWAVNFKDLKLFGLFEMFCFIGIFLVGFFYIVKKGALDWDK
jgi:NADH-quinone oxidoreductase subunit A